MIKNAIISGLLVYILSTYEGWAVQGFLKFLCCLVLTILLALVIYEIEDVFKLYIRR